MSDRNWLTDPRDDTPWFAAILTGIIGWTVFIALCARTDPDALVALYVHGVLVGAAVIYAAIFALLRLRYRG